MKRSVVTCLILSLLLTGLAGLFGCSNRGQSPSGEAAVGSDGSGLTNPTVTTSAQTYPTGTQSIPKGDTQTIPTLAYLKPQQGPADARYSNMHMLFYGGFLDPFSKLLEQKTSAKEVEAWRQAHKADFDANSTREDNSAERKAIADFKVTRQEFYDCVVGLKHLDTTYTKEMADAIYDHNVDQTNRLFVEKRVAFYNEGDHTVYGLRELSGMSKEQAVARGIQKAEIGRLLELWKTMKPESPEDKNGIREVYGQLVDFAHIRALYASL